MIFKKSPGGWKMEKWEEKLPPRVRERLTSIKITPEDRARIKAQEKVKSILSAFYQDKLTPEQLGEEFKKLEVGSKEFLIKEAQTRIVDSIGLQILPEDFKKRGKALLVLERLKKEAKPSLIKAEINLLGELIKRCKEEKERVYSQLKQQVEENPELRMRKAKTEGGEEILVQLSVDEAVLTLPEWREFVSQHEEVCSSQFAQLIDRIKNLL